MMTREWWFHYQQNMMRIDEANASRFTGTYLLTGRFKAPKDATRKEAEESLKRRNQIREDERHLKEAEQERRGYLETLANGPGGHPQAPVSRV